MIDLREGLPKGLVWALAGGIGALWILIALAALWSAARGFMNERYDWGLGWGLVGVLLLAAGLAAIIGTWWHQTRVMRRHD